MWSRVLPGRSLDQRRVNLSWVAVCASLLAACAGISSSELERLGSTESKADVHFPTLVGYVERAQAAYGSESAIRAKYPLVVRVATPGNTDVLYFVERDDKARSQLITVRGTVDRKNFSEDFDAAIRVDSSARIPVHEGFAQVADAIYSDVQPQLRRGYRTQLTGHSLGGAVAAVLAIQMTQSGYQVEKVVTFGQPRFTTVSGVPKLNNLPIMRIVDENDIIPMLPPDGVGRPGDAFAHAGPEVILLEGPRYSYLPGHDATRLATGELLRSVSIASLPDHDIKKYVARLNAKQKGPIQVPYNQREQFVGDKPPSERQPVDAATGGAK